MFKPPRLPILFRTSLVRRLVFYDKRQPAIAQSATPRAVIATALETTIRNY